LRSLAGQWADTTIAHAHTAMTGAVARWAGARHIAVTCHGWNLTRPADYDLQDALAFAMAGALVSPSAAWGRRLAALPGCDRVTVVPNGFDLSRYPTLPRRADRSTAVPRIVCVGEVTRRKGQDLLVQAMPRLWQDVPDAQLVIIGDGDLADTVRTLVQRVDPEGQRIVLRGSLPSPYLELAEASAFCLPSRSDNQPVAIIEAMLAGVPVVSTDVGGIPEMIDGADAGAVVAPESPDALAEGLRRVLSRGHDPSRRQRIEAFARHEYDVAVMAERNEAVYRSCLAGTSVEASIPDEEAVADPLRQS
jgi:phosphatidylinositol alpha-1,6-mannosyltransferase